MKNFALALLAPLLFVPFSPAETLDTVTFNPARLGQFERVKISDALNAPGGVKAQSVTVQSGGSVDVNNAGAYDISSTQVKGMASLPDTELYSPSVNAKGGSVSFDDTAKSSNVGNLTTAPNLLKLKANVLKMSSLKVTGEGGQTYGGESLTGLKLGGNEIKPGNNCKNLQWVKRTASDNNVYQVLAMGTCGGGSENKFYGPDITADQFTSDTCPDGDEETRSQTRFSCEANPSYKGKCVDLFSSYFYFSYEDTSATTDTCNGDTVNMFTKTMTQAEKYHKFSCVDVYKQTSSSAGEGVKSTMWQCNGNYVKYDGSVVNGPDAVEIECPCKYAPASVKCLVKWHRTDMCIHSGQNKPECYGASTTFTNGTIGPDSSDSLICAQCKGDCERVLVVDQIPGCPAPGLFNCPSAPSRWPVSYRWVNCKNTKARKVIYKRRIGYRKVDCSGGGDVEGTAPEDRGA